MNKLVGRLFHSNANSSPPKPDPQTQSVFPKDAALITHIFSFLTPHALAQSSMSCKLLLSFSLNPDLWRPFCLQRWASLDPTITTDWKKFFGEHNFIPKHAQPKLVDYFTKDVPFGDIVARNKKWLQIISKWDSFALKNRKTVKEAIAKGVPLSQRGRFWILSLNANKVKTIDYSYEDLNSQIGQLPENTQRCCEIDAKRFIYGGSDEYAALCKTYAIFDAEMGYCPALGALTSIILRYFDEKKSFYVLVNLMKNEKYEFEKVMTLTNGYNQRIAVLNRLFEYHLLTVFSAIKDTLPSMVFYWVSGTFYSFPLKVVDRFWDIIFLEGYDIIYFLVLAFHKINQDQLLNAADPGMELINLHRSVFSNEDEIDKKVEQILVMAFHYQEKTSASLMKKFKAEAVL